MNFKRYAFVLFIILCISFAVAGVSAADENDSQILADENTDLTASSIDAGEISKSNDNDVVLADSQSNASASSENTNVVDAKTAGKFTAKLSASKLKTTYGSGQTFQVKVIDSKSKKPVSNAKLLLKVYTAKKYKKVKVTTDSNGIAKYSASKLSIGTHKIIVSSNMGNVKAKSIKSSVKLSKAALIISAPKTTNAYKSGNFKLTVKNKKTKNPMGGIKLQIKVFTGKKYKTYSVKTNKNGEASISTKSLSKATHKVVVTAKSTKNYNAKSAKSSIIIKNKVESSQSSDDPVDKRIETFIKIDKNPWIYTTYTQIQNSKIYSNNLMMDMNVTLEDAKGNQLEGDYEIVISDTVGGNYEGGGSDTTYGTFGKRLDYVSPYHLTSGWHRTVITIKYSGNDKYREATFTYEMEGSLR